MRRYTSLIITPATVSAEAARMAGAHVVFEQRQGKGYVVQRMFSDVEADLYVMVDGDGTYPPAKVHKLIAPALNGEADMVVGSRLMEHSSSQFKAFNHIGNRIFWGRHQRYLQGEVVGYPLGLSRLQPRVRQDRSSLRL